MSDQVQAAWCQANRCSTRVEPGVFMCPNHARYLPTDMRTDLSRMDHRGVLFLAANEDTLARLEIFARAVELVAQLERGSEANCYRTRCNQLRAVVEREQTPEPATQGRLLEAEPTSTGPYGRGVGRDRP